MYPSEVKLKALYSTKSQGFFSRGINQGEYKFHGNVNGSILPAKSCHYSFLGVPFSNGRPPIDGPRANQRRADHSLQDAPTPLHGSYSYTYTHTLEHSVLSTNRLLCWVQYLLNLIHSQIIIIISSSLVAIYLCVRQVFRDLWFVLFFVVNGVVLKRGSFL